MKKISDLRMEEGNVSQRELAEQVKVTQTSVSRWEQEQTRINGSNLIKLTNFFRCSVDELLRIKNEILIVINV